MIKTNKMYHALCSQAKLNILFSKRNYSVASPINRSIIIFVQTAKSINTNNVGVPDGVVWGYIVEIYRLGKL